MRDDDSDEDEDDLVYADTRDEIDNGETGGGEEEQQEDEGGRWRWTHAVSVPWTILGGRMSVWGWWAMGCVNEWG